MTDNDRNLSHSEIEKVNGTIAQLQKDISLIEDNVKAKEFNDALKNIVISMKHTDCPVCKEKLLQLSADIIKTRQSCNENNNTCDIMVQSTIEKASEIRKEFVPISTEKRAVHNHKKVIDIPTPREIINKMLEERNVDE